MYRNSISKALFEASFVVDIVFAYFYYANMVKISISETRFLNLNWQKNNAAQMRDDK